METFTLFTLYIVQIFGVSQLEANTMATWICENAFYRTDLNTNEFVIELCEETWKTSFPNSYDYDN